MPHDNHAHPVPPREPDPAASAGPPHSSSPTGPFVPGLPYLPALPYGQPALMAGLNQAGSNSGGFNSAGILKAFRKRWVVALVLGLVFGGLAAAATWFAMPPSRYSGEWLFDINSSQPLLPTPANRTELINHQRIQQALVSSPDVLKAALRKPEVLNLSIVKRHGGPDAVEWLAKDLKTDYQMGPNLLHISLKEDNPVELRALIQAIGLAYLNASEVAAKKGTTDNIKRLETAANHYEQELNDPTNGLRRHLEDFQKKLPGSVTKDQDPKAAHDFDRVAALEARNRLSRLKDDIRKAQLDVERFKQAAKRASQITVAESALDRIRDAQMEELQRDIARLTPQIQNRMMLRGYQRDPQYRELYRQLTKANQDLLARRQELLRKATEDARALALHQAQPNLLTTEERLQSLIAAEVQLEKDAKTLQEKAVSPTGGKGNPEGREITNLKREIQEKETSFSQVRKEMARLDLLKNNPPAVTPLWGGPYTLPTNDIKIMMAATGAAGVLVFGLFAFGISWIEFRRHRIDTADEVVQEVGLPLVGTIPEFNSRPRALTYGRRGSVPADVQQNVLAESIDTIRTMLMHAARAESLQTVMIASAASREGKTTLACQLATSLARAGRKTLLIDGDLRKPMLHELYNAPAAPGLAELLRGDAEAADTVQQTFVPGLWILPAGQVDGRAIQALSHEHFRHHTQQLREDFDFIVVDSSPILSAVEPLMFAQQVDAVVFAVLLDVSQVPAVQAAYRRLQVLGVRILGAVVSGTDTSPHLYDLGAYAYRNMTYTTPVGGTRP